MTSTAAEATATSAALPRAIAGAGTHSRTFVYAFSALYAAVFLAAAATSYLLYLEPRFDLGNMVQVVWMTAHGHFLQMSGPDGSEMSRLGAHFDPFLTLFVPLWWAWSSPLVLLAAQAVAVVSGALPVYWLARKHLADDGFAAVFAVGYLLYPSTQFNAFAPAGIHAVSFAIPLLLYAIWFLDNDRLVPFVMCAALAATTKEEIAAAAGGLGIWYAVRRGRRAAGAVIASAGLIWTLVNVLVIIPQHAPDGQLPFAGRYSNVGGTPGGMLHVAVTDPGAFVHQVATWHKLGFLLLVFVPFLGLWALEPLMLVGAAPDLAINLLSSKPEQTTVFYQYTSGIIPFVVAASVLGAARIRRRRFAAPVLLGVMCFVAILSPIRWTIDHVRSQSQAQVKATRTALDLVPSAVPVSASQTIGAYVSTRRQVALFPNVEHVRWVIVGPISGLDDPAAFRAKLSHLKRSPQWRTVYDAEGVAVFERRPTG